MPHSCWHCRRTSRISDPAPLAPGLIRKRHHGVRGMRFVMRTLSEMHWKVLPSGLRTALAQIQWRTKALPMLPTIQHTLQRRAKANARGSRRRRWQLPTLQSRGTRGGRKAPRLDVQSAKEGPRSCCVLEGPSIRGIQMPGV